MQGNAKSKITLLGMEILKAWALDNLKRFHIENQVSSNTNLISSPNLYYRMVIKIPLGSPK
jgi:hypothetical protein